MIAQETNEVLFIIQMERTTNKVGHFSIIDEHILKCVCSTIAYRIRNINIYEKYKKLHNFSEKLMNSMLDLTSQYDMEGLLSSFQLNFPHLIGYEKGNLLVYEESLKKFRTLPYNTYGKKYDGELLAIPSVYGLSGETITIKQDINLISRDDKFAREIDNICGVDKIKNALYSPLICRNRIIGVAQLINKYPKADSMGLDLPDFNTYKNFLSIILYHMKEKEIASEIITTLYPLSERMKTVFNSFEDNISGSNYLSLKMTIENIFEIFEKYKKVKQQYGYNFYY